MPKNKGGKSFKRSKNDAEGDKRELVFKEDGQEYGIVTKMLGNGWLECNCCDTVKRMAHIRGAFRKKVWITPGDVVLLGLRDFQDSKADVILKYLPDEARMLKTYGELPEGIKITEGGEEGEEDDDEIDVEFNIDEI